MAEYISREITLDVIRELSQRYNDESLAMFAYDIVTKIPAADVQPVDGWISVKDRLPKTGESVLVYIAINKNLKGFGECSPEIRIGWLDDDGKWALQFSNINYSEVLCWLPLPELPKDGDTNG